MVHWLWVLAAGLVGFLIGATHALWVVWNKYDLRKKGADDAE